MKRNTWKELWLNRPTVLIPDMIRFMRKHPYTKYEPFSSWLYTCVYCCWQECWR